MSSELISAVVGFVTGLLGAGAVIWVYRQRDVNLERDEVRKKKIDIIVNLFGYRYILADGYRPQSHEAWKFNYFLNLANVYFSREDVVIKEYRKFVGERSTSNIIDCLTVAAKTTGLDLLGHQIRQVQFVRPQVVMREPLSVRAQTTEKSP